MIEIPDSLSREEAIARARILAKALHHARQEAAQWRRDYMELLNLMAERAERTHAATAATRAQEDDDGRTGED